MGVLGYEELVRAVNRLRRREHEAMLAWYGGPYDLDDIGEAGIVAVLGKLTRRRTHGWVAYTCSCTGPVRR